MPLLDHFQPPLVTRRHWHAFHNAWAANLAAALNQHLPDGYFAESNVQFGIEIDVATFEEPGGVDVAATAPAATWSPPEPVHTIPLLLAEETVEVSIYSTEAGPTLVGAVELVSPANKDRLEHREAFVAKCQNYLHQGLGLVIVDIVTNRTANLHHALLERLRDPNGARIDDSLYATAYRPIERNGSTSLQIWSHALHLGDDLPTMPLWLRGGPCVPVELESTYSRTCVEHRI